MIDFHTHILPGLDDGSSSIEESIEMLKALAEQKVEAAVLTPHYYSAREPAAEFLERRERSLEQLEASHTGAVSSAVPSLPKLILGAEVAFYAGMSEDAEIRKFLIDGTDMLMLEMPFTIWRPPITREVNQLAAYAGIKPVIAHVERYVAEPLNLEALEQMIARGAIAQANAEFFLSRRTRSSAYAMLRSGLIHIFGSDCHNMGHRKPNMGDLESALRKKLPPSKFAQIAATSHAILNS